MSNLKTKLEVGWSFSAKLVLPTGA